MTARPFFRRSAAALPLLGVIGACVVATWPGFGCAQRGTTGDVAGDDGGGTVGPGSDGGGGVDAGTTPAPGGQNTGIFTESCDAGQPAVDWSPMRRISRVEYDNMVRDLLGDFTQPAITDSFPPESALGNGISLAVNTYALPSNTSVSDYLTAAETIAENVVADTTRLNSVAFAGIASCATAQDDTCATDFIATWANRAYRGQLDATESAGLLSLYQTVKAQFDWPTGIQAIIQAVLESPRFLYVMEFGGGNADGNALPLSSYEVAARLSLFLWRSVPDQILMAAAAAGQLSTLAQIQGQATRMLTVTGKDASGNSYLLAQVALDDFSTQWIELTPIQGKASTFASFNNANQTGVLSAAMDDETRLDFSQAVLGNGSLTDLLTSTSTYANSGLQTFYGTGTPSGARVTVNDSSLNGDTSFTKTAYPNRPGILTTGAPMATQAHSTLPSFVLRGKLVREDLLCDPILPPPPNVPAAPSMAPDAGTTRELLLAHQQKGTICPSCHQYMDSIGAGFGNFDATGGYQTTDANGLQGTFPPIDASGSIAAMDPGGFATTYTNVTDLVTQLAGATQVRECFALQELRYALGRLETVDDACSAQQIYAAFSSGKFNMQGLLIAIVGSDAFRYRSLNNPTSTCQ